MREVLCAVPDDVFNELYLWGSLDWHAIYAGTSYVVEEHHPPCPNGYTRTVIYFREGAENQSYDMVLGEVAHEMAHMVLGHNALAVDPADTCEFDACSLAIKWGFGEQTLMIVDLPPLVVPPAMLSSLRQTARMMRRGLIFAANVGSPPPRPLPFCFCSMSLGAGS